MADPTQRRSAVEVRWLDLDAPREARERCAAVLSDEERRRVDGLATEQLRARATVRLGRRRALLADAVGVAPEALALDATPLGQPFVEGPRGHLYVSASSRGDCALLAWSRCAPIGVDVEALEELGPSRRLLLRVASPAERVALAALSESALREALLCLWTRKEAYLKCTGEGIGEALRAVTVPLGPLGAGVAFAPREGASSCWWVPLRPPHADLRAVLVVADAGATAPEVYEATD